MQQLSQSVCIGVTLSFGWLGKLSREAANRVRFEPRATFELRATSVLISLHHQLSKNI